MPLVPKSMGFRFQVRIEHLGPADMVQMSCLQCRKRYDLAPYQLLLRFTGSTHLDVVAERFKCCQCGWQGRAKQGASWAVFSAETSLKMLQ